MHEEPTANTLRIGGLLPPAQSVRPPAQDPATRSTPPVHERGAAGPAATGTDTRTARRRATASTRRRRGVVSVAAMIVGLGGVGALVGLPSEPESPAPVSQLPFA